MKINVFYVFKKNSENICTLNSIKSHAHTISTIQIMNDCFPGFTLKVEMNVRCKLHLNLPHCRKDLCVLCERRVQQDQLIK